MDFHQSANLEYYHYGAWDPWYNDQDRTIKCWEAEYVYTHSRVAHLLFRSFEFSHCDQVAQVAFCATVVLVMVDVHPCLCASSESADSLRAILARKTAIHLIFPNHGQVSVYRSVHLVMPGSHNTPLLLLSNLGSWFLDSLLRFCNCGVQKPCFSHFGHIQGKTHVGQSKLYPTSLSCHSSWHGENLQEISCCF